ncbi:Bug family tripartite tricarboxylate transporter substrate binding protein [Acidovorax sp.]|uniref:Bug family tripartite tricarboxylate transporter substrate binding protein n=1 Tax=Acidovorax sp. TaxID=1872122 RepID=UPI003D04D37C
MNSSHISRRTAMAVAAAFGTGVFNHAIAQTKHLSLIVPQPAGNPTDGTARKLQPILQRELNQIVVVENVPGAGGSLGMRKALQAPVEAPMLVITSQTEPILTPLAIAGAKYKAEDFRAVALVARAPYVLVGRPDLPANSLAELIELARRSADKPLSHGHIGQGSMIHLLGEQFSRKTGVALTHVAYRGVPPVVQDLMGGQIDLAFLPLGGSTPTLVESGKVRAYGVTASAPSGRLPKLQALAAQDQRLSGFVYGTWAAVLVSRAIPEAAVRRFHQSLATALKDPDVQAHTVASGLEPAAWMSLAQLDHFYQEETRLYEAMVREIGVTPQ